jgi:hypothetical protein
LNIPTGCSFHPRCPYVMDVCVTERPELLPAGNEPGHVSACHLPKSAVGVSEEAEQLRAGAVRRGRTQPLEVLAASGEDSTGAPEDRPSVEGVA